MEVQIQIKTAGRRQSIFELRRQVIPDSVKTACDLIEALVRDNVRAYNARQTDAPFFSVLTQEAMEDGVETGAVRFGDRRNEETQDEEAAVANALCCFEDGLFRLFVGDKEVLAPDGTMHLKDGDTVTFIRLTMLAGRRW
ncbi:MAG: hypothetical protein FWC40_08820 [Proteobacteria bacterium]|nr:hypothetical protein [Pseudomonadota bacterium]